MGGGNDGGSIPGRAELVKEKPKEQRAESDLIGRFRAKFCALTKERLRKPIVICRLGYLFNYETLLKTLIEKKLPKQFSHIKNKKNLKQITLTENKDVDSEFPFICPISLAVFNGRNRFVALWGCGCVFSEKIIKEIGLKTSQCPVCNNKFEQSDIIILGLSNEEIEMKRAQLMQEQEVEKKQKILRAQQRQQLDEFETVEKKVCQEKVKPQPKNKIEQLVTDDDQFRESKIYKSLFHKEYIIKDNMFTRNVRFGLR